MGTEESYDEGITISDDGINPEGSTPTIESKIVDESYDEKAVSIAGDEIETEGSTNGSETEESYGEGVTEGSAGNSEAVESYDENAEPLIEDEIGSTYAGDVTETTGVDGKLLMAPGDVNGEPMNEETEAATIEDQPDITEGSTNESQTEESYYEGSTSESYDENTEPLIKDEIGSTYAGDVTETTGADGKLLMAPEESYYEGSTSESYDENTEPITKDGINEGSISTKGSEDVDEPYDEKAELKIDDEIESEGSTKGSKMEYDEGIPEGSTSDSEAVESYDENGEPLLEDKK